MSLTREQSIELGAVIEQRRRELVAEIRSDRERTQRDQFSEVAGTAPDPGDESIATLIQDLDQADLGRDLDELRGIERARARIADGSYGTCTDCGMDIEYERLRASPSASRCIHCQRLFEKDNGRAGGPPTL